MLTRLRTLALAVALTAVGTGCNVTVEPGHVGVVTDWGDTQGWTYPEGFHWIAPIGVNVYQLSTQVQSLDFIGPNHITVLSRDRLQMGMDLSVQYRLHGSEAPEIFRIFYDRSSGFERYTERVVQPSVREAIRDVVSRLDALDAVQQRDQLGLAIRVNIRTKIGNILQESGLPRHAIRIVGVQVRNIELPERLQESIAAIQQAENEALQRQQEIEVARQEAERNRIRAEGQAAVAQIEAERDARVQLTRARATAEANREVSASLTTQILELRRIEAQRDALTAPGNRTLVVGGDSAPIIDLRAVTR
jgi:regulator of protease activity HflC (stomatin/prohibitin superfamily)